MASNGKEITARVLMGVAFGLHFVWFAFMAMGTWRMLGSFCPESVVKPSIQEAAADRMDMVATALAILAVCVGIASIGGFFIVRREAISAAEDEAKAEVKKLMALQITEYLERTRPDLLQELVVMAIKANPYIVKQALGVDGEVTDADAYSKALERKDPES